MDLRLGPPPRVRILPRPEEGLRAAVGHAVGQALYQVMGQAKDQAPKAEAWVARCVERTRPVWSWLAIEWRRLGTAGESALIFGDRLHALLRLHGMRVYG